MLKNTWIPLKDEGLSFCDGWPQTLTFHPSEQRNNNAFLDNHSYLAGTFNICGLGLPTSDRTNDESRGYAQL